MLREDFRFDVAPDVVEWLEANITLPRKFSPAFPGPYRVARNPTSREILDCWHPSSGVRLCTNVAGSQVAKTSEGVLGSAYRMDHSPMPELILSPSKNWMQREISEKRFIPLINGNPVLRRLKPPDPHLFRKMDMQMIGGSISLEGAGSDTSTAGSTQGIIWIEEAAKIIHLEKEDAPEAHPIRLAFERTKQFRGVEFHYLSFTPNSPYHLAWEIYLSGSQTHFFVPCPHCKEYFPMEFDMKGEGIDDTNKHDAMEDSKQDARPAGYRSLVWSPSAKNPQTGKWNEDKVLETTVYVCPKNGCEIAEEHRRGMIKAYETHDYNPDASKSNKSFRRPSFLSPAVTFGMMAQEFLKRGDLLTTGLQNFFNSWLAQTWEKLDCNVKDKHVLALRAQGELSYEKGTIPNVGRGTLILTSDPGETRTHWAALFVQPDETVWVVDYGTVLSIDDLIPLFKESAWPVSGRPEIGRQAPMIGLVDSGAFTKTVYKMCVRSRGAWWPTKGSDAQSGSWGRSEIQTERGLMLYTYVDKIIKDELYHRRIVQGNGRVFLPTNAGPMIIDGLCGQQRITQNGQQRWRKVPNDHAGDCVKLGVFYGWIISSAAGGN